MKFRQFNFNPFQRNKSKKKSSKQNIEEQQSYKDEILDQNSNKCDVVHFNNIGNFANVKYHPGTCDIDLAWDDEPEVQEYKPINVNVDQHYLLNYFPYLGVIDSVNFNGVPEQVKCSCKLLTDYCDSPSIYDKHNNLFDPSELSNVGEKKNNLRTARSRIKTNPWLPTPRPIFDISPGNSVSSGSDSTRCLLTDSQEVTTELVNSVSLNVCFAEKDNKHSTPDYKTYLRDSDRKTPRQQLSLNNLNCRWSIISDGDISIDLNASPILEDIENDFFNLEHNISFEYEDNVDLVLDDELGKRGIKTSVSINDLLEDSAISQSEIPSTNSATEYSSDDNCTCSEKMDDSFSDNMFPYEDSSDNEADVSSAECSFSEEFCSSNLLNVNDLILKQCNNLDDSIDAGYSSLKRDGRDGRFVSESESDVSQEKGKSDCEVTVSENEKENKPVEIVNDATAARTLPEIRSSLEEKVNILRLEKVIVQQKIREAQEEEQIRLEQRQKFSKQLSVHKKQVLLDTLNDLKDKLENQSRRLQKSYSAVLTMQKQFTARRASFSFVTSTNVYM